jgi:hypothetical protein
MFAELHRQYNLNPMLYVTPSAHELYKPLPHWTRKIKYRHDYLTTPNFDR